MDQISTDGRHFVDQWDRQRIFHGVNLVYKGERQPGGRMRYDCPWTEQDVGFLARQGFNVVRLGLIWDAVEPRPGEYDEAYLGWAASMLDACERHGVHAFLDMHQDLYAAAFSDGAPAWATLNADPFEATGLWSDAYLFSSAVQQAYDAFWENRPAADGVGLMDHYASMWAHVAGRLGGHNAVIGYDFLNEPYPGSAGMETFGLLMEGFARLLAGTLGREVTPEEAMGMFMDPGKKLEALELLKDKAFYTALGQAAFPAVEAFDRGALSRFYDKLTDAVRAVTPRGIVFRENSYFSNMGIPCAAPPVLHRGAREPLQAYAPHGYDLVVDTDALALLSDRRADVIFEAHREEQTRLRAPVLVGEWGALGTGSEALGHARHLLGLFDRWQWSDTYWAYHDDFDSAPILSVLRRTYPAAVAGRIVEMGTDVEGVFRMRWEDRTGCERPTELYLHDTPSAVDLRGEYRLEGDRLFIPPAGGTRDVAIRFQHREGKP